MCVEHKSYQKAQWKPFLILHFQSITNQIIFRILYPATPLLHPSPTLNSKLTLFDTDFAFVIFSHMEWPTQLIPRQAASQPGSQWDRLPERKHCLRAGQVVFANHWHVYLVDNTMALLRLFVPTKSSLLMPNWCIHTNPSNFHLLIHLL